MVADTDFRIKYQVKIQSRIFIHRALDTQFYSYEIFLITVLHNSPVFYAYRVMLNIISVLNLKKMDFVDVNIR